MKEKLKGIIIGVVLVVGLNYAGAAWSNPSAAPTGGNPDVPVNVGTVTQTKGGQIGATGFLTTGDVTAMGKIGIGTVSPGAPLEVKQPADNSNGIKLTRGDNSNSTRLFVGGDDKLYIMAPNPLTGYFTFTKNGLFEIQQGSNNPGGGIRFDRSDGPGNYGSIYMGSDNRLYFQINSGAHFALDQSGNVCNSNGQCIGSGGGGGGGYVTPPYGTRGSPCGPTNEGIVMTYQNGDGSQGVGCCIAAAGTTYGYGPLGTSLSCTQGI